MLIRARPADRRSWACWASVEPLVVIARSTSSAASFDDEHRQMGPHSGSPPVSRIESMPKCSTATDAMRSISSKVKHLRSRQPLHALLGHAVGAAEVAAIGHRDPQVAVHPAVSVHELRRSSSPRLRTVEQEHIDDSAGSTPSPSGSDGEAVGGGHRRGVVRALAAGRAGDAREPSGRCDTTTRAKWTLPSGPRRSAVGRRGADPRTVEHRRGPSSDAGPAGRTARS